MLPVFGNKVLGCHNCGIDIWSKPGLVWTDIAATASAGTSTLSLTTAAEGWQVGDKIVLASSDFDYN
jgi:hypothetical protein